MNLKLNQKMLQVTNYKSMRLVLLFVTFFTFNQFMHAQSTIRGKVVEEYNETPVQFTTVLLQGDNINQLTQTDSLGRFRFEALKPGRYMVKFEIIGFFPLAREVVLHSGKDEVIHVELKENIIQLGEVSISLADEDTRVKNDMILISGRGFNVEDSRRFAGSLNDPSRMAANFAGVGAANDFRNDIVIRGNSPSGLLWRMEGIDIPNPNHFAAMGTTGGPVNLLNINLLGFSDFITGAFPAEYGNALSGVFDLSLRKGNSEKREYTAQIGFNGLELGAEGPIGKNNGSYTVNYRYSTVELLNAIGVDIGTGAAVPKFQDVNFTIDLPSKNLGNFRIFGMGGISNIDFISERPENTNRPTRDVYFGAKTGVIGINHKLILPGNWISSLTIAQTYSVQSSRSDSITWDPIGQFPVYGELLSENKTISHLRFHKKLNSRNFLKLGAIATNISFNLQDSVSIQNSFSNRITSTGQTQMYQVYGQWKHSFNEHLVATVGLHGIYLHLNQEIQIEPRAALSWQFSPGHFINAGLGRHSQAQPINLMFFKDPNGAFPNIETNRNLGFSLSDHYVIGYEWKKDRPWRFKMEMYYQNLTHIPVKAGTNFSMINAGADFGIPGLEGLTNDGRGRNLGVEITAERRFQKGFYIMATTSIYDSKYRTFEGQWYNAAFNGNFVTNFLYGKEFKFKNGSLLSFDVNLTWAGGRRYNPIDLEKSKEKGRAYFDENNPFAKRFDDFFRLDTRITYRVNGKKTMQEWALDIQNVTNRKNIFMFDYDVVKEEVYTINQIGFFPIMFYRLYF